MARIFQDGFELGRPNDTLEQVGFGGFDGGLWQIASSYSYGGVRCVKNPVNSGQYALFIIRSSTIGTNRHRVFRNLGKDVTELYGRVEVYIDGSLHRENQVGTLVFLQDSTFDAVNWGHSSNVMSIRISRTGDFVNLSLWVNNQQVDTYSEAFLCNTWARIEWHLLVDDTNGSIEVRRNGDTLLSYSGNTDPLGSGHIRYLCLGCMDDYNQYYVYFDDVAVNDTTGSKNNSWPGRGRIIFLSPKADGNHIEWEGSEQSPNFGFYFARDYMGSSLNSPTSNLFHEAFNQDSGSYWYANSTADEWVGFKLRAPVKITKVTMTGSTSSYNLANFRIEGSHDGESWDVLTTDYYANNGINHNFEFPNTTAYLYYRIYVIDSYSRCYVRDVRFYQEPADAWAALFVIPDTGDAHFAWSDIIGQKLSVSVLQLVDDLGYDQASVIEAVQLVFKGRFIDGAASIQPFIKLGVHEDAGDTKQQVGAFWQYHQQIWDKNPWTNDEWDIEELDELEAGVEHKEAE